MVVDGIRSGGDGFLKYLVDVDECSPRKNYLQTAF